MNNPMPKQQPTVSQEELQYTRPFLWFLTVVLVFLYIVALRTNPALREPQLLLPFTALMIAHGALHWLMPRFVGNRLQLITYAVVQIALAFTLCWLSDSTALVAGLYLALAGETIGILGDWPRSLVAVIVYIGLMGLTSAVLWGWDSVPNWIGVSVLMALFVLLYVLMYMRQMNARSEAQRLLSELEVAHRQLGEYAQEVEHLTLEAERQRMARELHDTLAQGLAGVILQLEALEAFLEKGDEARAAEIAGQAKGRARETLADARRAIDDLRDEDALSPEAAIRREAERFSRATGIPCTVTLAEPLPLTAEQADHVLRCISEGLANVAVHAQASEAQVAVETSPRYVTVTIRDNGRGFDTTHIPNGHYGLIGLRERARLAGGTLAVDSAPEGGSSLSMTLPVQKESVP